jgi:hypothetical protein
MRLPRIHIAAVMAILACLFLVNLSDAQDIIGGAKQPVAEVSEVDLQSGGLALSDPNVMLRLYRIESRLAELEETQLDEADVRRIAEDVFRKMSLTVGLPGGGQRSAVVNATSGSAAIQLAPGEVLMGYTDPVTGQYVRVQQQQSSGTVYRMASSGDVVVQQVGSTATVSRPVLRATGRVLSAPFRAAAAGTCRIVNGQRVCN